MILIGSTALAYHGVILRNPQDHDLIGTNREFVNLIKHHVDAGWKIIKLDNKEAWRVAVLSHESAKDPRIIECYILDDDKGFKTNQTIHDMVCLFPEYGSLHENGFYYVAKPEVILALKLSHRFRKNSPHFSKTREDILALRKEGIVLTGELDRVMKIREQETLDAGYSLNVSKKDFFTDNVPYKYDHDSLHKAIAIGEHPAYTYYIADKAEVMCSKDKFFACNYDTQISGVVEEAMVLALERAIIPFGVDEYGAFRMALEKVCTSITKGWFREFAWENYDDALIKGFRLLPEFMSKYNLGLENGTIVPFNPIEKIYLET